MYQMPLNDNIALPYQRKLITMHGKIIRIDLVVSDILYQMTIEPHFDPDVPRVTCMGRPFARRIRLRGLLPPCFCTRQTSRPYSQATLTVQEHPAHHGYLVAAHENATKTPMQLSVTVGDNRLNTRIDK
jgi:hypothetical protein